MPRTGTKLTAVLEGLGAKLKRGHKHRVYELPNGNTFVTGKTPSDCRAELNAISDVKRAAGVVTEHREGERRVKRRKPGRAGEAPWAGNTLATALNDTGLVERQLREENETLARKLDQAERRCEQLATEVNGWKERFTSVTNLWPMQIYRWFKDW